MRLIKIKNKTRIINLKKGFKITNNNIKKFVGRQMQSKITKTVKYLLGN